MLGSSPRPCGLAVLLLACVTVLPAQERKPLVGTVVDAAGAAVTGADVTLVWSPPGGSGCGPADIVEARTDARGRFIVKLLAQETYSAWALGAAGEGGVRPVSAIAEGVAAGGEVELRLDRTAAPFRITLRNTDAWAGIGPFSVQVAPAALNVRLLEAPDGVVPPLPPVGFFVVRDRDGAMIHVQQVAPMTAMAPGPELSFALPGLRRVRLRVTDPQGQPLANALVRHAVGSLTCASHLALFRRTDVEEFRVAGQTGVDGIAEALVPETPGQQYPRTVLVSAPGLAERQVFLAAHPAETLYLDGELRKIDKDGPIPVPMQPAARLRLILRGAPMPAPEILFTAAYRTGLSLDRAVTLTLDERQSCEVPLPVHEMETMLHVRPAPGEPWHLRRVPLDAGKTTSLDLHDHRPVELQLLDAQGGPLRGVPGVVMPVGTIHSPAQQVAVATDQAGRFVRWLGPDAWILLFCDGTHWLRYDVPLRAEAGAARAFREQIRCRPTAMAEVHVVDGRGQAVAGVTVLGVNPLHRKFKTTEEQLWGGLVENLNNRLAWPIRSDPAGRLRVSLLTEAGQGYQARLGETGGGQVPVRLDFEQPVRVTVHGR